MTEHAAIPPHAIRHRAYERWLERGSPVGSPEQDWLDAERELVARAIAPERALTAAPAQVAPAVIAPQSSARRRAPRSIVTRAGSAPAARLLLALVPDAAPTLVSAAAGRTRR